MLRAFSNFACATYQLAQQSDMKEYSRLQRYYTASRITAYHFMRVPALENYYENMSDEIVNMSDEIVIDLLDSSKEETHESASLDSQEEESPCEDLLYSIRIRHANLRSTLSKQFNTLWNQLPPPPKSFSEQQVRDIEKVAREISAAKKAIREDIEKYKDAYGDEYDNEFETILSFVNSESPGQTRQHSSSIRRSPSFPSRDSDYDRKERLSGIELPCKEPASRDDVPNGSTDFDNKLAENDVRNVQFRKNDYVWDRSAERDARIFGFINDEAFSKRIVIVSEGLSGQYVANASDLVPLKRDDRCGKLAYNKLGRCLGIVCGNLAGSNDYIVTDKYNPYIVSCNDIDRFELVSIFPDATSAAVGVLRQEWERLNTDSARLDTLVSQLFKDKAKLSEYMQKAEEWALIKARLDGLRPLFAS